jgi:hypothetical protein
MPRIAHGFLLLLAPVLLCGPAAAETKLTDFNGAWQGAGVDRNTPFESTQQTSCHAAITADLRHMKTVITCHGVAGLDKVVQLIITLTSDDAFTGTLTQKATTRGSSSETNLEGSVTGHKTDKNADFRVSFPGLTPSVDVALALNNPSSFSMRATTIGGQLMNVTFNRTSKP